MGWGCRVEEGQQPQAHIPSPSLAELSPLTAFATPAPHK